MNGDRPMTEPHHSKQQADEQTGEGSYISGVINLESDTKRVSSSVTPLEDELLVEIVTKAADGTLIVNDYRLLTTRTGNTVIPKYDIDPQHRLIVASVLKKQGYRLEY